MRPTLVILTVLLAVAYTARNDNELRFRFGRTTIEFPVTVEVYRPRGVRVYIPNKDGLEFFSFHGRVNSPVSDIDGGTLAEDITANTNGLWVFENRTVQLQEGDVLNFWIFLQYRGSGQRFNGLSHIVRKLTPAPFPVEQQQSSDSYETIEVGQFTQASNRRTNMKKSRATTTPAPYFSVRPEPAYNSKDTNENCGCNEEALKDVWAQMNATAGKMRMLEESYAPLEDKLKSLTETVDELIKNMNIGTNLLLTGNLPVRTNPVEDVRHLIIEKLRLPDLSMSILQAEYKNNGISFEVSSSIDKLRILKRSKDILSKLSYQIIDPDRPPFDVRSAK